MGYTFMEQKVTNRENSNPDNAASFRGFKLN